MAKTVYLFHHGTRQFAGTARAELSPRDGALMLPANATLVPPPDAPPGKVALFATTYWVLVDAAAVPEWRN